jgi:nucleoside-diphosphate-sugar epimerase
VRAIEAPYSISGVFNIASGNFTVGEVADFVFEGVREHLGVRPQVEVLDVQDFRNYKVSIQKAADVLSFKSQFSVADIVRELCELRDTFGDFSKSEYYNIQTFMEVDARNAGPNRRVREAA